MGRSDGTLIKGIPALDRLIPHFMNRRYDATNYCKVEFDITNLKKLLQELRDEGHKVGTMDAIITAFAFLLKERPEINRFIANKKIYQRNHVCVSFAMIKRGTENQLLETVVKVYIEPDDNLITISNKIRETIEENRKPQTRNAMDRFIDGLVSVPFIPGILVSIIKILDKFGILPKAIIKLSPFHTSLFISNLASLRMDHVYHHLSEFGTNSLFITLGKPRLEQGETNKNVVTLGVAIDERICIGAIWAKAFFEFKRCIENPERLLEGLTFLREV